MNILWTKLSYTKIFFAYCGVGCKTSYREELVIETKALLMNRSVSMYKTMIMFSDNH